MLRQTAWSIVRRKTHANTEFGTTMRVSLVNGNIRIERLSFEPYNDSEDFGKAVFRFCVFSAPLCQSCLDL